jgi:hypothetical protein
MITSSLIKQLVPALLKARQSINPLTKEAENPFFHSKYATLDSIIEATKESLLSNGLWIIQGQNTTRLVHESGEWIEIEVNLPAAKNDPQGFGSAMTYARRYGYSAILGLATEEDDDANGATAPKAKETAKVVPTTTQPPKAPQKTASGACAICGTVGKYHKPGCPNSPTDNAKDPMNNYM